MPPPDRAKRAVYSLATRAWACVLRHSRSQLFQYRTHEPWQSGNVLILAPHPDDECLGSGGTALLHRERGDPVTVAVVTDGRSSEAVSGSPAARAETRRREAKRACARLDATLVWMGLPEDRWTVAEATHRLAPLIDVASIIYLPSPVDFHPAHLAVARLVAPLLSAWHVVRVYELGVPLTPTLTTLLVETTAVARQAAAALSAHDSQRQAWGPLYRRRAYRAALYGCEDCEPFWALTASAYQRMLRAATWTWRSTPFRGLRPRPFSDGWAYLQGEGARRDLWRAARCVDA